MDLDAAKSTCTCCEVNTLTIFQSGEDESQAVQPKELGNDGVMKYRTAIKTGQEEINVQAVPKWVKCQIDIETVPNVHACGCVRTVHRHLSSLYQVYVYCLLARCRPRGFDWSVT